MVHRLLAMSAVCAICTMSSANAQQAPKEAKQIAQDSKVVCRRLLDADDFKTSFSSFDRAVLPVGTQYTFTSTTPEERIIAVKKGLVRLSAQGNTVMCSQPDIYICPVSSSLTVHNTGADEAVIVAAAARLEMNPSDSGSARGAFSPTALDTSLLRVGQAAHRGYGALEYRRLWSANSFVSNFFAVSHAVLQPGDSIGYHLHKNREEIYYAVRGTGRVTVDYETVPFLAGDASLCGLGSSHGVWNNSEGLLELLVMSVSTEKGKAPGDTNLGDDLVGR